MSRWDAGPGAAAGPVLIKLEWRMWTLTDRASGHAGLVQGLLDAPPFEAVSKEIIPSFACSSLSFRACCLVLSALLSTLLLLHECSLESNTSTVTACTIQIQVRRQRLISTRVKHALHQHLKRRNRAPEQRKRSVVLYGGDANFRSVIEFLSRHCHQVAVKTDHVQRQHHHGGQGGAPAANTRRQLATADRLDGHGPALRNRRNKPRGRGGREAIGDAARNYSRGAESVVTNKLNRNPQCLWATCQPSQHRDTRPNQPYHLSP